MMIRKIKKLFLDQISFFISLPAVMWQLIFLWLPLAFIIVMSVLAYNGTISFTFANYGAVLNSVHWYVIGRSLLMALLTTALCLFIAYPVAYFIARRSTRFKTLFLFFLGVPFWVNFLIHIYAWFFVLDFRGVINSALLSLGVISSPLYLLNSMFAIGIVMFYCYFPFMVLPLYTVLDRFDKNLLEAAADLGAPPRIAFRVITLPLTLTGIRAGVFLVFISSFGEYAIPLLMGGGKKLYVGSLISNYMLLGQEPALGSAFTIVSSLVLLVAAIAIRALLRKEVVLKGAYW